MTEDSLDSPVRGVRWSGTTVIVEVAGDIDLSVSSAFQQSLLKVLDRKPKKVVVNMAGVPYMDSSGVASLVKLLARLRKSGGTMCLVGVSDKVRNVLEITRLDSVFEICATEEEAGV
jgi:anti-sigma B factor antagonist